MTETQTDAVQTAPADAAPVVEPANSGAQPAAPPTQTAPTAWITARLEVGPDGSKIVEARVTVSHPFGQRSASAHGDVPEAAHAALQDALFAALQAAETDVRERAEEAALEHRIRSRQLGEDFHAEPAYVGPEVTIEDQHYDDPALMAIPAGERQAAIEKGVTR